MRPKNLRHRKTIKRLLISFYLVLLVFVLEVSMRLAYPYLLPQDVEYTKDFGVPKEEFERKIAALKKAQPDFVVIGDSFVETGSLPFGWILKLEAQTGKRFFELGFSGLGPTQYFHLLERVRREGIKAPVIILFYIGNDFCDEGLWASLGKDKSGYYDARIKLLSNPEGPLFWPCLDLPNKSWLTRHSAIYRTAVLGSIKVKSLLARLSPPKGTPANSVVEVPLAWNEGQIASWMDCQCGKTPYAERVGERLFFFPAHEAMVNPQAPLIQAGRERILQLLRQHRQEPNLIIAVTLDREEHSQAFHGRPLTPAAPFISQMIETGVNLFDPNQAFILESKKHSLYLPDGHWDGKGHQLFARELQKYLGLRSKTP